MRLQFLILVLLCFATPARGDDPAIRRAEPDWWSLQPLRSEPPTGQAFLGWQSNAIDSFVASTLAANGLSPRERASRRVLIRRLYFGLLGLPPAPDQVREFATDRRADAYERLVDRILGSPEYGIRWGRHWLDLARFGESQGFERDKIRTNSWPYRDWVIDSLNEDRSYREFSRHQIAGDLMPEDDPAGIVATGFLVAGPYDEVGHSQQSKPMKAIVRQDELEDIVSVVGQTFLGLTIHCARCHDHKFDPISQREYYRFAAALQGVWHGSRELPEQHGMGAGGLRSVYAVLPRAPGVAHLLLRGNPATQAETVRPGAIAAVAGLSADFGLGEEASDKQRRSRLANWVANRRNPLFARVAVNRIWHYHFGTGLVDTPNDLGFNGGRPTHPELIDFLAREFLRSGWSIKSLHRLIITSSTYRQSSLPDTGALAKDAENRLLWRKSPMRLEAEALRDAILDVSGVINWQKGGPGYQDFTTFTNNTQFYVMKDRVGYRFNRRSIYRTWVRSGRSPFLDAFDCPDPSAKAPNRAVTTTPLQALTLMNNSFVIRMARHFADRVRTEAGPGIPEQIARAFLLAYGRSVETEELRAAEQFVVDNGLEALCRVIFNSNEFLYIH